MPLSWTLDKLGPLARSADCCARVLQAIAGSDRHDPSSARRPFRYQPLPPPALRRLRLGFAPADFDHLAAPEARPAFSAALDVLWELGAPRAEVGIPPGLPYGPLVGTIIGAEEGAVFGPLIESEAFQTLVDAKQKAGLRAALGITARDYLDAMRLRVEVQRAFGDLFRDVDVLVGVGRPGPAPPLDEPLDRRPAPGPRRSRTSGRPIRP